jgi:hypothetical protein
MGGPQGPQTMCLLRGHLFEMTVPYVMVHPPPGHCTHPPHPPSFSPMNPHPILLLLEGLLNATAPGLLVSRWQSSVLCVYVLGALPASLPDALRAQGLSLVSHQAHRCSPGPERWLGDSWHQPQSHRSQDVRAGRATRTTG